MYISIIGVGCSGEARQHSDVSETQEGKSRPACDDSRKRPFCFMWTCSACLYIQDSRKILHHLWQMQKGSAFTSLIVISKCVKI